jgi:transposase InsO family protein
MSAKRSPVSGKRYGIERVCRVVGYPRSSFYSKKRESKVAPKKRGPKPSITDEQLLELIRSDLARSPFSGEGHRKVWGRLKYGEGYRVSRKRVLRIMREYNLLSPYRRPQGEQNQHTGEIITQKPNEMWGTDGSKVFTVQDGYTWIFAAVEHWNAECMGNHVSKNGDRFAAMEPVLMGIKAQFGHPGADVARGLSLRMDHGSQYLSDHFQKQIRFFGIAPSFAFLREPETNGVVERFFRTLKEQVIYGKSFQDIEELTEAVSRFVGRYNTQWRLEKMGYMSPVEARQVYEGKLAA